MSVVIMPKMGDAMEEGTLIKWLKAVGDEVAEGESIAEIETDKITLEMEAQEGGFLTSIIADEGAVVPIGEPIATIGPEDEVGNAPDASAPKDKEAAAEAASADASQTGEKDEQSADSDTPEPDAEEKGEEQPAPESDAAPSGEEREPNERFRASPYVKRLAEENGLDLTLVEGSGPNGRIVHKDVEAYISGEKPMPTRKGDDAQAPADAASAPASKAPTSSAQPKGTKVDMPKIKKITGDRMSESKLGIPHYYVTTDVDMTAALEFRKDVNAKLADAGIKVSVNDLVVKATALALVEHPNVNREYVNGDLYQRDTIDINMAIAIDGGLIAPFIPNADQKSLGTISKMAKDLGKRAREGGLQLEEFQGGTFTISNLGMFDVDEFIAVINPPQVAILAIGSVAQVPVVRDGEIVVGDRMKITLSADHRALDGAEVATFLQSVRKHLENPVMLAIG